MIQSAICYACPSVRTKPRANVAHRVSYLILRWSMPTEKAGKDFGYAIFMPVDGRPLVLRSPAALRLSLPLYSRSLLAERSINAMLPAAQPELGKRRKVSLI